MQNSYFRSRSGPRCSSGCVPAAPRGSWCLCRRLMMLYNHLIIYLFVCLFTSELAQLPESGLGPRFRSGSEGLVWGPGSGLPPGPPSCLEAAAAFVHAGSDVACC